MSADPTHGNVRIGDVSGTAIVGDNNRVTTTKQHPEPSQPPHPRQQNSAEDQAAVFSVYNGDMTVHHTAAAEPEPEPEGKD
ncbi:hypothetical protein [Streptacidiphilus sp. MAP5-3]|jgi:hypothetical protein|uniref:hypothetical protein n=1 Tax=unclassified Streptacidiphilus TaxID=2643834 RepID=UPI003512BEAA